MLKDSGDDADVSEEVTAAAFADSIRNGQIQDWHGRRVIGDLELSGVAISSQLVLQQVVFTGDVNFGQARFERSVDLTGCRFERKLIFADAIVSGTLTLDDVQIGSPSEMAESSLTGEANGVSRRHVAWKGRHRSQDRLTESTDSLPKQETGCRIQQRACDWQL